jgi:hypothetical protein
MLVGLKETESFHGSLESWKELAHERRKDPIANATFLSMRVKLSQP